MALRTTTPPRPIRSTATGVLIAGDFSVLADIGLAAAGEVRALTSAGYAVSVLHLPEHDPSAPVSPEMQRAVRDCEAAIVPPGRPVSVQLVILHAARNPQALLTAITHTGAAEAVLVLASDCERIDLPANVWAAAADPLTRQALAARGWKLARQPWPFAPCSPAGKSRRDGALRVGILLPEGEAAPPPALEAALRSHAEIEPLLWRPRSALSCDVADRGWQVLDGAGTAADWLMRRVDALIVAGQRTADAVPHCLVHQALALGLPVAMRAKAAAAYQGAAVAGDGAAAADNLLGLNAKERAALLRKVKAYAAKHCSEASFIARIQKLVGHPKRRAAAPAIATKKVPRVLFVPKGGVGIGHVARTLAIARRARGRFETVFATLAEQPGLVESFGFRAEYIPSGAYAGLDRDDWEPWFEAELRHVIDGYRADAVVFDGSDPSEALLAAAAWSGCRLAWIRRGMWGAGAPAEALRLAPDFDLILEPGELAAERDRGATATRRHEARQVAPVTLLERSELLSREDACAATGLDPSRPAVLLQLGSGENRDIAGTLDILIAHLETFSGLQIAVAEWPNAPGSLRLWSGVKVLRGAPLSLYAKAFDFAVGAAGYNSFHEAIHFGLPTIFVPNDAPGMDDQRARAQFAQDKGAAIELPQDELTDLPQVLAAMMQPDVRAVMRRNCEALYAGNGAMEASAMISALAE